MQALSRYALRQEIKKLNRLNPKDASYTAITQTYRNIMHGMTLVAGKLGGGELFYRVRKTGGYKPNSVKELHAPPANLVTGYQRCNPPGIPMFYGASKRIGAIYETRVEAGDTICLSQWIGNESIPVNKIFDSEENQEILGVERSSIEGPNDDILLAYLDTQFTKRIHTTFADDYKFTSAIAQELTCGFTPDEKRGIKDDGFIALKYPSVLNANLSYNTAMHSSFAADRLELIHVMEIKVLSINGTEVDIEIIDTSNDIQNGCIIWSGRTDLVPEIISEPRGVPFIFDGRRWSLLMHEGPITREYINMLMTD
ncbi:RES family NAD+ phosphorylase [Agrobacterium tumefaciens]|uniref:RES family NAD+ phosphorylase n=1 Tax=Agrobacterium tumefaciens TaxID=358 RepID=UPI001571B3A8|nr:RES family NAD+ phosphorylase [Agrobacterium tumefaciens]NTB99093.1 RES family NAD+ phosphorylase [Agrobacterium tumefaciens]NTC45040.1 RES family NAD+ phosphorylase [Agrobacterium tumefaciens]